jgi:hypothetical protein
MRTRTCATASAQPKPQDRHRGGSDAFFAPLVLLAFVSLPANAQERETRDLTGFNAVAVGGGIDLFVRQGQPFRVEVAAADGHLDEIVTEVIDGRLEIRRKRPPGFLDWGDRGTVSVVLPALVGLTASGGSDLEAEGTVSGDTLTVVASGGSDVTIAVAVTQLEVTVSGGSDVQLSGSAGSARVQSSGGSDLNASRLMANAAEVDSSGGSDLSIAVRDALVANASGGSDVSYTGKPSSVRVNASGGGDIRQR